MGEAQPIVLLLVTFFVGPKRKDTEINFMGGGGGGPATRPSEWLMKRKRFIGGQRKRCRRVENNDRQQKLDRPEIF